MAATPADVRDLPNASQFIIDIPGLKSRDIMIQVEDDNVLLVTGERKREEEKEGVKYVRIERPVGKFMRKFVLPENAKIDAISTVCQDGVLTVTVEKLPPPPPPPPPQPKTIEDKMPKNERYGAYNMNEAPQEAHDLTHPNPVPAPLPLVAPPFENALLNLSPQQQWHEEQPPEVNWYVEMRSVDAPSFDGMQDPSAAEEWIRQMETLYMAMGVPDEKRVSVVVPFLTELAEEWYETVKGTNGISDWTTFKQLFNKEYVTARYRVQKQREFYSLSQEGMTVGEYATKFIGLLRYVPADFDR